MRIMSYTCISSIAQMKEKWLKEEVGVPIFRKIEIDPRGVGPLTQFVFCVEDEELEIILKLKYPPGTFRDHMV